MAQGQGPNVRVLWRNIHLWIGLSLFLVLAPLGLSGSLLVWDDAIDQLQHPHRYEVTSGARAPGDYLAAASRAFAGRATPAQIRLPRGPGQPVTVTGFQPGSAAPGQRPPQLTAWIDPGSGRVLDVGDPRRDLRGVIHRLHGNLMLPQNGRPIVGWLGVAMLASSVSGLIIWWPRSGGLARAVRWRRSPSTFSNLHQLSGFIVCVPLAVLSFSGAWIALPQMTGAPRPAGPQAHESPRGGDRRFAPPLGSPHTGLDAALAAARAAAPPGARLAQITLPTISAHPAWRFQFQAGERQVAVGVEDAHGKVRPQRGPDGGAPREGGSDPFARFMRGLHDGSALGPLWKAIIALTGLAPTILGVTGAVLWSSRRLHARSR